MQHVLFGIFRIQWVCNGKQNQIANPMAVSTRRLSRGTGTAFYPWQQKKTWTLVHIKLTPNGLERWAAHANFESSQIISYLIFNLLTTKKDGALDNYTEKNMAIMEI